MGCSTHSTAWHGGCVIRLVLSYLGPMSPLISTDERLAPPLGCWWINRDRSRRSSSIRLLHIEREGRSNGHMFELPLPWPLLIVVNVLPFIMSFPNFPSQPQPTSVQQSWHPSERRGNGGPQVDLANPRPLYAMTPDDHHLLQPV